MKIAILGHSGSGKSTLASRLGKKHGVAVLHIDTIQFLPGWKIRPQEEKLHLMREFLDTHDGWVIDGNYSALEQARRLEEADQIIVMEFNRFASLYRAWRRYRTYRGQERESMAEGCPEKIDWPFVKWILWEGRSKDKVAHFRDIGKQYPAKTVYINTQRQLDKYMRANGIAREKTGG